jgi:hypothetical protein
MCDPDVISDTVLATVSGELRPSSDNVISNRFAQRIQPVARFTRATPRFVQKAENLLRTTRSTFDHRFKDPTLQRFSASARQCRIQLVRALKMFFGQLGHTKVL